MARLAKSETYGCHFLELMEKPEKEHERNEQDIGESFETTYIFISFKSDITIWDALYR
jgi:hypothetical protein